MSAYERLLPEGAFPFYVLFLSIDPQHIDINVHPTKTEIKFDDERSIYAIIQAAVRKTLSIHNLIPSLDFDSNVNFTSPIRNEGRGQEPQSVYTESQRPKAAHDAWKKLFEGLQNNIDAFEQQAPAQQANIFESGINAFQESTTIQSKANGWERGIETNTKLQFIQVLNKYILVSMSNGTLVVDQKRAYQRIMYDQFMENLNRKNGASQQVLFPQLMTINPADQVLLAEIGTEINDLGFRLETNAQGQLHIVGVPTEIGDEDGQSILEGILEQIKHAATDLDVKRSEKIAQSMANRSAIRYQQRALSQEEVRSLIEQLFASTNPNFSPNGERISHLMTLEAFEGLFS
jgi:DNA mismatch repair protein MutL